MTDEEREFFLAQVRIWRTYEKAIRLIADTQKGELEMKRIALEAIDQTTIPFVDCHAPPPAPPADKGPDYRPDPYWSPNRSIHILKLKARLAELEAENERLKLCGQS